MHAEHLALVMTISIVNTFVFMMIAFASAAPNGWLAHWFVWSVVGLAGVAGFLLGKPLTGFFLRSAEKGGPFRHR